MGEHVNPRTLAMPHPLLVELRARETLRQRVASAIDRLIDLLDALDGDPDLEPSLGSVGHYHPLWAQGSGPDECEDVAEDEGDNPMEDGDDSDLEPSLGSLDRQMNQWAAWTWGCDGGGDREHDGRELQEVA